MRATFEQELTQRDATGGVVAVGGDGRVVVAHNSPMMFSARGAGARADGHDVSAA